MAEELNTSRSHLVIFLAPTGKDGSKSQRGIAPRLEINLLLPVSFSFFIFSKNFRPFIFMLLRRPEEVRELFPPTGGRRKKKLPAACCDFGTRPFGDQPCKATRPSINLCAWNSVSVLFGSHTRYLFLSFFFLLLSHVIFLFQYRVSFQGRKTD